MIDDWSEHDRRLHVRRHGDRREGSSTSRRTYIGLCLCVVALIIYGSLYPFRWVTRTDEVGPFVFLMSSIGDWDQQSNLAADMLLYLPFGFLAMYALPLGLWAQFRVMATFAAGILLSVWLELAQYQEAGHTAAMADVYGNGLGLVIGIAIALLAQSRHWPAMRALGVERVEMILLAMWAGDRLYPYAPLPTTHDPWQIVARLTTPFVLDPLSLARAVIGWLMVAFLADQLVGERRWWLLFPVFMLCEFAARIFIGGLVLSPADIVGAVTALLAWLVLRELPLSRVLLAIAFAALVIVVRLAPFDFVGIPSGFGWLPFQSFMGGPLDADVHTFFADGFLYGGLIWLLTRAGLPVGIATAATALLLLGISVAQCWTTGTPGEITDALIAAAIGSLLYLFGGEETAPA